MNAGGGSRPKPRSPWKRKMGPEFSGLERPRDFLVAFTFVAILLGTAALLAFLAFR